MQTRTWLIGAAIVAIAGAGIAWWVMKPAAPRVYAEINEVPAGGILIDDIDTRWSVRLPEGWRFKVTRHANWGRVRAISPGTDVRLLDNDYARKSGETLCDIYTNFGIDDGKTQADKNAELPAKLARANEFVQDGDVKGRELAFADSETINGIGTLTTLKAGIAETNNVTNFFAKREAYMPIVALFAHCTTVVPTSAAGYESERAIKDIVEVTRSFTPL